jgi:Cdc6-like AAA superfamily ATPase
MARHEGELGYVDVHEGLKVCRENRNSSVWFYINRKKRSTVTTGSYVQSKYSFQTSDGYDQYFLGIVDEIMYTNVNHDTQPSEGANRDREFDQRDHRCWARVDPLTVIVVDPDSNKPQSSRVVDMTPQPNSPVHFCEDESYLRTGLNISSQGLTIGHLARNGSLIPDESNPLTLNIPNPGAQESGESALFRHTLISGSTGKGKTFFAKNYIRQIIDGTEYEFEDFDGNQMKSPPSVVIIDPEGEYTELAENPDTTDLDDAQEELYTDLLQDPTVQAGGITDHSSFDLQTFIPWTQNSQLGSQKHKKTFSIPFRSVQNTPELLLNYQAEAPTRNAITGVVSLYFDDIPEHRQTYDHFIQWLDIANSETDNFDDHPIASQLNIFEGAWQAMMNRVKNKTYFNVFDADANNRIPTEDMIVPGRVSVVPTNHLNTRQTELIVMSIMNLLVHNKVGSGSNEIVRETPVILALDEAHNFLGDAQTVRDEYILHKFRQIAKQGRKYKLGLFNITQNPEDVDNTLLKQTNTKVFLGLEPEVLEQLPLNTLSKYKTQIANFGKGQAIVKSPDMRATEIVGFPVCLTRHSN